MSDERKKYLRNIKIKKSLIFVSQILILIVFLGLWEYLADKGIIDKFITSSPSRIIKVFANFNSNHLLFDLESDAKHILSPY